MRDLLYTNQIFSVPDSSLSSFPSSKKKPTRLERLIDEYSILKLKYKDQMAKTQKMDQELQETTEKLMVRILTPNSNSIQVFLKRKYVRAL